MDPTCLTTTALPVSAIRIADASRGRFRASSVYLSTFDPEWKHGDALGEQGIFCVEPDGVVRRLCVWPRATLIAVDGDHVYFSGGCVRRVRVSGGEVRRVLLNGFDVVVERERLFGVGYTYLLRMSRRASWDGHLDDEGSDMTHYQVSDPRRIAVDDRYVYATVGDPPHTRGSRESIVRVLRDGDSPAPIAALREQVAEMAVAGRTLVVRFHDGPIATLSTDGGAVHEIAGTEGVELVQVVSEMIYWVAPYEPRARLVRRRVAGGPIETVGDLGMSSQPRFVVSGDDVVWAEPTRGGYRADGRAREHRILMTKLVSG